MGIYPKQHGKSATVLFFRKKEAQHKINVYKISSFLAAKTRFFRINPAQAAARQASQAVLPTRFTLSYWEYLEDMEVDHSCFVVFAKDCQEGLKARADASLGMQGLPVGTGKGYIRLFHVFKEISRRGLVPDENVEMAEIFSVFFVSVSIEMFRRNINKEKLV